MQPEGPASVALAAIPAEARAIEAWFDSAPNRERSGNFGGMKLAGIRRVLARLPAAPAPVTIAGTKGKGSTLRFLEQLLLAHGRRTVAFTSPHVRRLHERWRLDGEPVTDAPLAAACTTVATAEARAATPLTWFERCFAVAVVLAAGRPEAEFLLEVGLGGRLDCSNTLEPHLAILTHLSFDHTQILGRDLESIAREKLAIGRQDIPFLIAPQTAAGQAAIRAVLPPGPRYRWVQALPGDAALGLGGAHQHENAATALTAAELLLGVPPDRTRSAAALAGTRLAARSQLLEQLVSPGEAGHRRRVLVDGAHNAASIAAILRHAATVLRPGWGLILGLAQDKDLAAVLPHIADAGCPVWRCGYRSERSRGSTDWPGAAAADWPWQPDIASALAAWPPERDLLITGSFYLAGEALAQLAPGDQLPG